jgi:hypothetical protein
LIEGLSIAERNFANTKAAPVDMGHRSVLMLDVEILKTVDILPKLIGTREQSEN